MLSLRPSHDGSARSVVRKLAGLVVARLTTSVAAWLVASCAAATVDVGGSSVVVVVADGSPVEAEDADTDSAVASTP